MDEVTGVQSVPRLTVRYSRSAVRYSVDGFDGSSVKRGMNGAPRLRSRPVMRSSHEPPSVQYRNVKEPLYHCVSMYAAIGLAVGSKSTSPPSPETRRVQPPEPRNSTGPLS